MLTAYKKNTLKIPDFQRLINEAVIEEIVQKIMSNTDWIFIQGNLTCCYIEILNMSTENSIYLIDGQHRLKALMTLKERNFDLTNVHLDVIFVKCRNKSDIEKIFTDKNKNTPMEFHYIYFDDDLIRGIIFQIKKYLEQTYRDGFRKSAASVDTAHLTLDEYMRIFTPERIKDYYEKNPDIDALIGQIDTANQLTKEKLFEYNEHHILQLYMKDADYKRAVNRGFYLPYKQIISSEFIFGDDDVDIKLLQQYKKKKLNGQFRNKVWEAFFTTNSGTCYICNFHISSYTFEAGHIIAESKGGLAKLHNFRPVCKTCNNSMGTKNMDEYKKEHDSFFNDMQHMKIIENNMKLII